MTLREGSAVSILGRIGSARAEEDLLSNRRILRKMPRRRELNLI